MQARKWNKNRLMMELVSRWGSPLTSEAPHSMAYPSPVKRRGHTTDLSDCQGPSARPTLSLSVWSWRGQASRSKATKHCSPLWMTKPTPHVSKTEQWRAPSQVSHQTCRFFFTVCDCRDGSVGLEKFTQCGSRLLLSQKPDIWTDKAICLHAAV